MKYNKYSKYKDSGVEWIGEIPEEWEVLKLFVVLTKKDKKNDDGVERKMLSVSQTLGIIEKKYDSETQMRTQEESSTYRVVEPGELVVNNMWIQYRGLGVSSISGIVSPAYHVYKINSEKISPNFLHFLVRSDLYLNEYRRWLQGIRTNSLQISTYDFTRLPLVLPSRREQEQIYDFLQNETAQFDELIAKSKAQITLLEEKRQATITQAVTKGLDPSVRMKDSDVEWIGEIPEGWREPTISNLKHMNVIIDFQDGNHGELHPKGNDFSFEGRPFLTANQIDDAYNVDFENCNKLPEEFCKKLRIGFSQSNDILFCHNATVGRIGIMPSNAPDSIVGTSITYYRINNEKINRRFFAYMLGSDYVSSQYEPIMKQSTRNQFSILKQAKLKILFPTKEESDEIAEFLDKQTIQFDELIAKSKAQITLLEEKRQALIAAIVTGKIDVRSEVAA